MNTVTVTDHGFKQRVKALASKPPVATVGVHSKEGSEAEGDEGLTVAEVAAIHEFGLGVPERSWLRAFIDENRDKLGDMLKASAVQVAKGMDPEVAMDRFGLAVVGMVKERIIAGIDPELDDKTKAQKQRITGGNAKDTPLILFGQFIGSVTHELLK